MLPVEKNKSIINTKIRAVLHKLSVSLLTTKILLKNTLEYGAIATVGPSLALNEVKLCGLGITCAEPRSAQ
jgi:hypothetical protein